MMTLDPAGLEAAAKALSRDEGIALWDEWTPAAQSDLLTAAEAAVRAYLAAAVPTDGKTLSREFDEDGRALCFQCGEQPGDRTMSGHLDGPPPGPPDPPYIPGDLGAPSAEEFARRRGPVSPEPERNPYRNVDDDWDHAGEAACWDEGFTAGLQKHDGGLWDLAFAAGRGAERERIVAALEADYRANVADGADGIYTDGLHDAWRLTVRRAKRDDLIKPVSGSSEPRKETT